MSAIWRPSVRAMGADPTVVRAVRCGESFSTWLVMAALSLVRDADESAKESNTSPCTYSTPNDVGAGDHRLDDQFQGVMVRVW